MNIRTKLTRQILKDSLVDLLTKKELRLITVKELCATAGVNKSTLYAYYSDIYALYGEAENDFIQRSVEVSNLNSGAKNPAERKQHYKNVCEYYRQNRKYLIVFFNNNAQFTSKLRDSLFSFYRIDSPAANKDRLSSVHTLVSCSNLGYMFIIYKWLTQYPETPVDEVAELLMAVTSFTRQENLESLLGTTFS